MQKLYRQYRHFSGSRKFAGFSNLHHMGALATLIQSLAGEAKGRRTAAIVVDKHRP
jgi:hypothetical protein